MNKHAASKHKLYLEGINLRAIRLSAHRHIKLGQKWSKNRLKCWWQIQVKLVLLVCCVCIFRQFNNVEITLQWVLAVVSGWITLLPVRFCVMQWNVFLIHRMTLEHWRSGWLKWMFFWRKSGLPLETQKHWKSSLSNVQWVLPACLAVTQFFSMSWIYTEVTQIITVPKNKLM